MFYGRNVNFDRDTDLDIRSAQVLALDRKGRVVVIDLPPGRELTPAEIKKKGLTGVTPFIRVRRQ